MPAPDPHDGYERRQVYWLFISFFVIGLMAVGVMLYGAWISGWRPRRP